MHKERCLKFTVFWKVIFLVICLFYPLSTSLYHNACLPLFNKNKSGHQKASTDSTSLVSPFFYHLLFMIPLFQMLYEERVPSELIQERVPGELIHSNSDSTIRRTECRYGGPVCGSCLIYSWKSIGILATGCRRQGTKTAKKQQKTSYNCKNPPTI